MEPNQHSSRPGPTERSYIHGHEASVLKSHGLRTASNSCAYLLPYIKLNDNILDVGCGPGSITLDLASYVPQGSITGIDIESARSTLEAAQKLAQDKGKTNVKFQVGDVGNLADFKDNTFDIVHAHQVLQHVPDPIAALKEMQRVCKPGGLIATRETVDFIWHPPLSDLDDFWTLFYKVSEWTGGTPTAGRQLKALARKAGFNVEEEGGEVLMQDASTWCHSTKEEIGNWAGMWAERVEGSSFHRNALQSGLATEEDLKRLRDAWLKFMVEEDAWFTVVHGEMILRKAG